MKSRLMVGVLAALAMVTAGCFKSKTLVVVNPDGSGNIVVSSAMSPQVAAMMGGLGDSFGAALGGADGAAAPKAEKKDPFFDEDKLKKAAAHFGEGVTYVKGRASDDNGWKGSVAVYSFTDINKVKLSMENDNMGPPGMEHEAENDAKKKKDPVTFEFAGGDTKTLKIHIPQPDEAKKASAKPTKAADPAAAAMMDAMLPQFKGMEMSVGIQVKGQITDSNAMNKDDKGVVTLMHMNMDEMMTSPKFKEMMAKSQGGEEPPPEEMIGMPGVKVETNKIVTVSFK